jgi:hypothetical protein
MYLNLKSQQKRWEVWIITQTGRKLVFAKRLTKKEAKQTAREARRKSVFSDVVSAFIRYEPLR